MPQFFRCMSSRWRGTVSNAFVKSTISMSSVKIGAMIIRKLYMLHLPV